MPAPWVSMTTPARPTHTASNSLRRGYTPKAKLMTTRRMGMTAMTATTKPDAMVCSAYAVPPMPPPSINVPTMKAFRHSRAARQLPPHQQHPRDDESGCHEIEGRKTHQSEADHEVG